MFYAANHLCGGETDIQQRPFMEEDRENVSTFMEEKRKTCPHMPMCSLTTFPIPLETVSLVQEY